MIDVRKARNRSPLILCRSLHPSTNKIIWDLILACALRSPKLCRFYPFVIVSSEQLSCLYISYVWRFDSMGVSVAIQGWGVAPPCQPRRAHGNGRNSNQNRENHNSEVK